MVTQNKNLLLEEHDENVYIFSRDQILGQVDTILKDPIFANSEILKHFLSFIVMETLDGNSNRLKEYTIGVNVLRKPVHFNTQECGIVRIHAGRLRRALKTYYKTSGLHDTIHISIPVGQYVPIFSGPDSLFPLYTRPSLSRIKKDSILVSVRTSIEASNHTLKSLLLERFGISLTHSFMKMKSHDVVTHYPTEFQPDDMEGVNELSLILGVKWLVAATLEVVNGLIRISLQVNRPDGMEAGWRYSYEREVTSQNILEKQNEIMGRIIADLESKLS